MDSRSIKRQRKEWTHINKAERKILWEIQQHSNIVPGIRNQMDTGAATSQRYDLMEQAQLTSSALFNLFHLSIAEEDWEKEDYTERLNEALEQLREFKRVRENEQWERNTQYSYSVRLGSW